MTHAQTHYAKADDGASQVVGDGPVDLIFVPWWWNHLESQWDDPPIAHFLDRLASFSRLILFDMRGIGLWDPASLNDLPTLERWTGDARAVLDAVGSAQAMVFGHGDGELVAMLFAATYPERTSGLVLADTYALLPFLHGDDLDPDIDLGLDLEHQHSWRLHPEFADVEPRGSFEADRGVVNGANDHDIFVPF